MIRFSWMARLAEQVPREWAVTLEPMETGETVVGFFPDELVVPFRVSSWAKERADAILEAHLKEDRTLGKDRPECIEAEILARDFRSRGDILWSAVEVGIREEYHLAYSVVIKVRREGVVVLEPKGHTLFVVPRRT